MIRRLWRSCDDRWLAWVELPCRRRGSVERFGLREAIGFARQIDVWNRYAAVCGEIRRLAAGRTVRVLELGSGPTGVATFLEAGRFRVVSLDLRREALAPNPAPQKVVGDMCDLPFAANSFDLAVSVDSLEHVPAERRGACLAEMRRVTRRGIVIHCPADGKGAEFVGAALDARFQRWHRRLFGREDPNTAEHVTNGLPSTAIVRETFPDAHIRGSENAGMWLATMVWGRLPILQTLCGLAYRVLWHWRRDRSPTHSMLVVAELPQEPS